MPIRSSSATGTTQASSRSSACANWAAWCSCELASRGRSCQLRTGPRHQSGKLAACPTKSSRSSVRSTLRRARQFRQLERVLGAGLRVSLGGGLFLDDVGPVDVDLLVVVFRDQVEPIGKAVVKFLGVVLAHRVALLFLLSPLDVALRA